jgi:L-asparaginase / beta-aspartyl-peptidase
MQQKIAIAIHGGAGTLDKEGMSDDKRRQFEQGLEEALGAGIKVLEEGGTAVSAVEAAVMALENDPKFNAGRGSVLTSDHKHEMDAAIMDGKTLSAGAVAGVFHVKNPVHLARRVMEKSEYVFLCSQGAMNYARQEGLLFEDDDYFTTQDRIDELNKEQEEERAKEEKKKQGKNPKHEEEEHEPVQRDLQALQQEHKDDNPGQGGGKTGAPEKPRKFGTVGAVALDKNGNLAAATSTGGLTNKKFSRVGDTPIIGGGTYANNDTCAISCTGEGEEFIQAVIAYDISCLMEYAGLDLKTACQRAMNGKLKKLDGSGGLISIDKQGNVEMTYNTEGMYRASLCGKGIKQVKIFE